MAEGHTDFCCPSPLFINPPRSQRDHVSVRVEPLQWHYLPVGRNQFLFRAQQTQMQFDDGKISKSGHDQILSISQITGLTFERFTNTVCSLRFLTFFIWHFFDMLNGCQQQFPTREKTALVGISQPLAFPTQPVRPLRACIQKSNVWKHLWRRSMWTHKPTVSKGGVRFSYRQKMGWLFMLQWNLKKHIEICRPKALFILWCMINGFHSGMPVCFHITVHPLSTSLISSSLQCKKTVGNHRGQKVCIFPLCKG